MFHYAFIQFCLPRICKNDLYFFLYSKFILKLPGCKGEQWGCPALRGTLLALFSLAYWASFPYSISRISFCENKSIKRVDSNLATKNRKKKSLIRRRYTFTNLRKLVRSHLCKLRFNITNAKRKVSSFYFRNRCNGTKICFQKLLRGYPEMKSSL